MSTVRDRSNKTNKKVVWNQRKTNSIMAATQKMWLGISYNKFHHGHHQKP
jgi:hypothetical protein